MILDVLKLLQNFIFFNILELLNEIHDAKFLILNWKSNYDFEIQLFALKHNLGTTNPLFDNKMNWLSFVLDN